jgi:hypothetical protein
MQTTAKQAAPQSAPAPAAVDEHKLQELLGRAIVDFGGASIAALVLIGDRLGLYRALAADGAASTCENARRKATHYR